MEAGVDETCRFLNTREGYEMGLRLLSLFLSSSVAGT